MVKELTSHFLSLLPTPWNSECCSFPGKALALTCQPPPVLLLLPYPTLSHGVPPLLRPLFNGSASFSPHHSPGERLLSSCSSPSLERLGEPSHHPRRAPRAWPQLPDSHPASSLALGQCCHGPRDADPTSKEAKQVRAPRVHGVCIPSSHSCLWRPRQVPDMSSELPPTVPG